MPDRWRWSSPGKPPVPPTFLVHSPRVAANAAGAVLVAVTGARADFGLGMLPHAGGDDAYIARLAP
jgi:hypothetical protein